MNFYAVLGIPQDADDATIRVAYKTLVRRYHPDRGAGSSLEKFRAVTEAYETLGDPRRRQLYDRTLAVRRPAPRAPVEPIGMWAEPIAGPEIQPVDVLLEELLNLFWDGSPFFRRR